MSDPSWCHSLGRHIKHGAGRTSTRLDDVEDSVRDKKLIALVVLLIALSLGHDADHIARGDIHWQLLPYLFC